MRLRYALVAVAVFAVGLAVATSGAPVDVLSAESDTAGDLDVIELNPHPGADGNHTFVNDEEEIEVVLSPDNENVPGDGVNADAVTDVGPLFTISNLIGTDEERIDDPNVTVWIAHDSEAVEFYAPGSDATLEGDPDGAPEGAAVLEPGDTIDVSMLVDTRDTDEIDLLQSATVYVDTGSAVVESTETPTEQPEETETPTEQPEETETPTEQPEETETPGETDTPEEASSDDGTVEEGEEFELAGLSGTQLILALLLILVAVGSGYAYRRFG